MLVQAEIDRRLPLWWALADLLLDTDMPHVWGANIANEMLATGFALEEPRRIFFDEVGPAFAFNLSLVAGEWAGWETEFVRKRVIAHLSNRGLWRRLRDRALQTQLRTIWERTLPYLLSTLAHKGARSVDIAATALYDRSAAQEPNR